MTSQKYNHPPPNKIIRSTIDRRVFLQKLIFSASSFALFGCGGGGSSSSGDDNAIPDPSSDTPGEILQDTRSLQSIIIVGAGISGLVAGLELSIAGHEVIFLEARERSGGRVNTLYSPFSNGQFAETGASRIPSNHQLTLDYINYFDLTLELFYPTSGDYFSINNNQVDLIDAATHIALPPWQGSVNRNAYRKIAGGMSGLPNAFTDFLSSNIYYSQAVEFIEQNDNGVIVTTTDGENYTADRVLCTVPIPVLNKIQFSPALSTEKNQASNDGYHYSDSSRLYTQFSERFWQSNSLNGWGSTDHPEEIWQPTWGDGGNTGIIHSYFRGTSAEQFDLLSQDQQILEIHNRWRSVFPNLEDYILNNFSFSWA
ncbi:MAG: NAD(P)-binding protein, partial [Gammaproteobacteria bacterium]|nr:NAD(P)-binding protein [Gammaproteobacteria bacterium]